MAIAVSKNKPAAHKQQIFAGKFVPMGDIPPQGFASRTAQQIADNADMPCMATSLPLHQHHILPAGNDDCCCHEESSKVDCCSEKNSADNNNHDNCANHHVNNNANHNAAPQPASAGTLSATARFRWQLTGLDCGSCARKVENAVRKISGVEQVQVIFSTQKLLVNGTGDNLSQAIEQAVHAAGYQLQSEALASQPIAEKSDRRGYLFILSLALLVAASGILTHLHPLSGKIAFTMTALIGVLPIARQAVRLIRSGNWFAIETLMTVAAVGALIIGATAEAAMVLLLFLIGEQLESWAASRARRGVSALIALKPETATRLREGKREQISPLLLQPGDIVEVAAGGRLPADGKLLTASASFDESMLTGESLPAERHAGERVAAGVTSVDRLITLQVLSKPGESAIDRIIRLIEEAEERRAPIERFIDRFSRIYTPAIIIMALLVAVAVPLLTGGNWQEWIYKALALLLIGCPCALVISTPAAITSGLATAARIGALVKGGAALEQLSRIKQLAFDKTGTLTQGQPQVCHIQPAANLSQADLLALAAAVEQGSRHPLAQAIISHARQQQLPLAEASDQRTLAGIGIEAQINQQHIRLSAPDKLSPAVFAAANQDWRQQIAALENQGQTVVVISRNGELAGIIGLRDTLRQDAKTALQHLRKLAIQGVMLTGDNARAAALIANDLNLQYHASLLPENKVALVQQLNQQAPLAMVGDGINDAPAMKAASIGIAMGNGSDVALETADIALTHSRLSALPALILLAKATRSNVRQNISIALGLKALFLTTTLLGISGLWLAVLADTGATVLVTLNALRLLTKGKKRAD